MRVKIYRYRVQPERVGRFLDLQRRADWLYRKHLHYKINHFQSRADPAVWVEVHWYPDEAQAQVAEGLVAREPELARLFAEFLDLLDPNEPRVVEEVFDDRSIRS